MPHRDWKREVQENLQEFERRQASVLHNPALSKLYFDRGIAVALVVVLTYGSTRIHGVDPRYHSLILGCLAIGTLIATAFISIALAGRAIQRREKVQADSVRTADDSPAIGW
jgi:hypothetical protein